MRISIQIARLQMLLAALILMPSFAQAASTAVSDHTDAASLLACAFQIPRLVFEELIGELNGLVDQLKALAPGPMWIAVLLVPVLALTLLSGLIAVFELWTSGADRYKPRNIVKFALRAGPSLGRRGPTGENPPPGFPDAEMAT